jgi:cytochrome c-type biogenesis protein CcmF
MLAYRVFRSKPLAAGGWLAHVGIGLLMIGVIVSNTYERTQLLTLNEGDGPQTVFGYKIAFEGMSGKPVEGRPINPEYDPNNAVQLRITPPGADRVDASGGAQTFVLSPRWFAAKYNPVFEAAGKLEPMTWPAINKYVGHDLYVGLADWPGYNVHVVKLKPGSHTTIGPYDLFYLEPIKQPGQYMAARIYIKTADGQIIKAEPGNLWVRDDAGKLIQGDEGGPIISKVGETIPELKDSQGHPGAIILDALDAATDEAELAISLPEAPGMWRIPLSVTYKPWVNLVWVGVLIAVMGTLLAMIRRTLEARRGHDDGEPVADLLDTDPDSEPIAPKAAAPLPAMPIKALNKSHRRQVS